MQTKSLDLRHWQALHAYLKVHAPSILQGARRLRTRNYAVFEIGRPGFQLTARVNTIKAFIGAELFIYGSGAKEAFARLKTQKVAIEKIAGGPLSWDEMRHARGCRVALYKSGVDPTDEGDWPNQHAWLSSALIRLDAAFRPRVCAL